RDALTEASVSGVAVTDEASAIEAAGYAPLLVPGAMRNFKVTWPDDFELMEKWL
ncbi:2-C-methyl-D-erythritol 4-phosphate cytidylyltransferase, partial [Achromobacter insolitus]